MNSHGACIFIHAGAGYHSVQNEKFHLQACEDAANAGMQILRNGGSAVDGVEMAIKVLEDIELTNSGFGSNLAMDGTVECDATIVDHLGRSGAVGAIGRVLNPISVARLILDYSLKPMSLHRVPPNLLVGEGATDFAFEHRIPVLPNDALVSAAARERWRKWRHELQKVEADKDEGWSSPEPHGEENLETQQLDDAIPNPSTILETGTWNEGQPPSPPPLTAGRKSRIHGTRSPTLNDQPFEDPVSHALMLNLNIPFYQDPHPYSKSYRYHEESQGRQDGNDETSYPIIPEDMYDRDGSNDFDDESCIDDDPLLLGDILQSTGISPNGGDFSPLQSHFLSSFIEPTSSPAPPIPGQTDWLPLMAQSLGDRSDNLTDTVGAIAIDCHGNIAAGSSSGGIGMKHRGRIGPAALVGIGTHIIPLDSDDKLKTCVATVASGTGEHMATTMAASMSASRLYHNQKKGKNGKLVDTDEEHAIRSFIEKDFLDHPSVKNSQSLGAIGILGVKKTPEGVYFYFAHNTDSFAIAAMHEDESEPWLVMSRNSREQVHRLLDNINTNLWESVGSHKIASGARVLRHHPEKTKSNKKRTLAEANSKPESSKSRYFTRRLRSYNHIDNEAAATLITDG